MEMYSGKRPLDHWFQLHFREQYQQEFDKAIW